MFKICPSIYITFGKKSQVIYLDYKKKYFDLWYAFQIRRFCSLKLSLFYFAYATHATLCNDVVPITRIEVFKYLKNLNRKILVKQLQTNIFKVELFIYFFFFFRNSKNIKQNWGIFFNIYANTNLNLIICLFYIFESFCTHYKLSNVQKFLIGNLMNAPQRHHLNKIIYFYHCLQNIKNKQHRIIFLNI